MSENPYEAPRESAAPSPLAFTPGTSPYGPFRETKTLSWAVVVFLGLGAVLGAVQIFALSSLNEANLEYDRTEANLDELDQLVATIQQLAYAEIGVGLITIILWCVWKNLSCKNAWLFRSGNQQSPLANHLNPGDVFTPGWAVGWYFIPFANLWKPFQAMAFIRNEVSDTFKGGPILGIWWTAYLVMNISSGVLTRGGNETTTAEINEFNSRLMLESGIGIAAAIPAILVIITITRAQQDKARVFGLVSGKN